MKRKTILATLLVLALTSAVILSAVQIYNINVRYPQTMDVRHKMNEEIDGGAASVRATGCRLASVEDVKKAAPDYEIALSDDTGNTEFRFLLITVLFHNNSNSKQELAIPAMLQAQTETWSNGMDLELFHFLNPGETGPGYMEMEAGSKKTLVLPYLLTSEQFKGDDWSNVEHLHYQISVSIYPVKHVIDLKL